MGPKRGVSTPSLVSALELDHLPPSRDGSAAASLLNHSADGQQQHRQQLGAKTLPPLVADPARSRSLAAVLSLDAWFFEILALIITAAAFVTLVAVLYRYDGKPTPVWKAGMTINVFVSLISAIFRITIMLPVEQCISQATWTSLTKEPRPLDEVIHYDSASRGPLGSVLLIFRSRLRYFTCLGAAITITAIVTGPFFQSSIQLLPSPVENPHFTAEATTAYTYNGDNGMSGGGEFSTMQFALPHYIRSSMYSGLLSSPMISLPVPPYSCPSGNCTWDPFATLAVGTQCVDFDSYIRLNCTSNGFNRANVPTDDCAFSAARDDDTHTQEFLTGTGNQTLMKYAPGTAVVTPEVARAEFAPLDIGDKNGALLLFQWIKATSNIYRPADTAFADYIQRNTTFEARRCLLYVCARTVSAAVARGTYSETVLGEIAHATNASSSTFNIGEQGLTFHLAAATHGVRATTLTLPQNSWTMLASELIQGILNASVVTAGQGPTTQGPAVARMLYATDNTTQALEHMAHYLNVALRANDSVPLQERTGNASAIAASQAVNGTVWVQEIFVRVRWGFLVLPAVVLVLAGVFLVVTVVKSRPESVGLWKSNPLTLLLHADYRGHEWGSGIRGPMASSSAVEGAAAGMKVDIVMREDCRHVARISDAVKR